MGLAKFVKQLVGIQAYQDRKEALVTRQNAEFRYESAKANYDKVEQKTKYAINEFGKVRLNSLKNTVGRFLTYLKDMEQKNILSALESL